MRTGWIVLAVVAAVALASVPALAVNWVQVGSTLTDTYSSPLDTNWTNISGPLGDVPVEFAIAGGVIPNLKVTYHLTCNGVDPSIHGYQTAGRKGLALFVGDSPSISDGLFSGTDIYWENSYYGALVGPTGSPTPGGTVLQDLNGWAATGYSPYDFNITLTVVNGVATTVVESNNPLVPGDPGKSYAITSADIANWSGQMKFAVYRADCNYSKALVSDITFYADQPVPEPSSLFGLAAGLLSAGGLIVRRRRS